MTLEKAIEILDTEQKCLAFKGATNRKDAIKLGIEALKAIKGFRYFSSPYVKAPLNGETK